MSKFDLEGSIQVLKYRGPGRSTSVQNRTFTIKRRELVSKLYLTGNYTCREIAAHIKEFYKTSISHVVIADDLKKLRAEWQENALRTTNEHFTAELAKCKALEETLLKALEDGEVSVKDYVTEHTRVMKRRAAMLGLDKATKVEVHDKRMSDLSDEELDAVIKAANGKEKTK